MKALLHDRVAPPQQRSARAFGQLRNAKQGQDQSVTSFDAYISGLAHETDVSDATKRMFLLTGLRPEVRGMMPCSVTYEAFDAMVKAVIWAKNDLQFEAECARTWSNKDKETDKVTAKHEQQKQNHPTTGHDAQGADRSLGGQGGLELLQPRTGSELRQLYSTR
jgi:hypothetical protein